MTTALMSPPSASATMTFGLTTPTKPTNSTNKISSNNGSSISSTPAYKVPKFLRSLYSILQNEDLGIVTWVQNAELKPNRVTAFHILAQDRFENEVLPKYFKHSKFASFQRQLNNFGFRKWTKTQSSGVCTFSHNCFPPDPREAGVLRASIREQWRQKNTTDTRRRVGNGITKAERKLQQQVQQQVQQHQLPTTTINATSSNVSQLTPAKDSHAGSMGSLGSPSRVESFSEMLKTPLPNELDAFSRAPTHQPLTKTLARPGAGEWVSGGSSCNGLESPVKPAHLPHVSHNNTINIGTATPHQHVMSMYPVNVSAPSPPQPAMVITTTQLEPWAWNPHAAPVSYEVHPGSFHMEMGPWTTNHNHHLVHHQDPSLVHKGVFYHHSHHAQQQVSPSSMEEFTFDNLLLFAE